MPRPLFFFSLVRPPTTNCHSAPTRKNANPASAAPASDRPQGSHLATDTKPDRQGGRGSRRRACAAAHEPARPVAARPPATSVLAGPLAFSARYLPSSLVKRQRTSRVSSPYQGVHKRTSERASRSAWSEVIGHRLRKALTRNRRVACEQVHSPGRVKSFHPLVNWRTSARCDIPCCTM